jgi:hypothetical protein
VQEKASTRDGGDRSAGCVWVEIGIYSYNVFIVSYRALCLSQFLSFFLLFPWVPILSLTMATIKEPEKKPLADLNDDDAVLEQLGYTQGTRIYHLPHQS